MSESLPDLCKPTLAYDPHLNVCAVWFGTTLNLGTIVSLDPLRWRWSA